MGYNGPLPQVVNAGGTGDASVTAYAVLCGGTTSTAALQSIAGVGSSGQVLTSNGAAALPTFQAVSASGAITTINGNSGSITPTAGAVTITGGTTGLTTSGSGSTLSVTGTLIVANGGTGNASTTAYALIAGGTTSTGALQAVSGVGTTGQVLTSNGASALPTWQSGASVIAVTSVTNGASPYTVLSTDEFLACQTSGGVITVRLPNAPTTGRVIIIKDSNGAAATSNISVTTVGGTVTIDGQTTYTMNANRQSISVVFDGSNYEVF